MKIALYKFIRFLYHSCIVRYWSVFCRFIWEQKYNRIPFSKEWDIAHIQRFFLKCDRTAKSQTYIAKPEKLYCLKKGNNSDFAIFGANYLNCEHNGVILTLESYNPTEKKINSLTVCVGRQKDEYFTLFPSPSHLPYADLSTLVSRLILPSDIPLLCVWRNPFTLKPLEIKVF